MTLISLLKQLYLQLDQRANEHLTQQQLRKLNDHLLADIGFKHDGARIVPLSPQQPTASELNEAARTVSSTETAAYLVEPQNGGG